MRTLTVTVEPDGRIAVPGTQPGQTITIHIEPETHNPPAADPLSPEEQERLIQEQLEAGRRFREQADPEWLDLDHGDWLYGPDGLPR